MPQSLSQIYLHLVFSTKLRQPFLDDRALRDELHKYLGGTCNKLECQSLGVGGVADHVHILCRFGRNIAIAVFVRELKRESSKWLKTKSSTLAKFQWQNGYGAFSLSPSHVEPLKKYIANQERHHQKETYQFELRRIMTKYRVEWDERYVWD